MEEIYQAEEESRRRGRVFNWQTATYGKIRIDDDLHDLSSVEDEFPAIVINNAFAPSGCAFVQISTIVYNDAQTSKSDLLIEPILNPRHIDEFNNETSVSEYDEEEQNILYFNDIFPFNIIRPDDLKSGKDKNDNDVAIIHSSEGNEITHRTNKLMDTSCDKIDKIFNEESLVLELNVNIIWLFRHMSRDTVFLGFDFGGLPNLMAEGLSTRMLMEHRDDQGTAGFGAYWADSARQIPDKGDLMDYWIGISSAGDFLGTSPSYTMIQDPILRLCHRLIASSIAGRSQTPDKVTPTDLFYLRGMDIDSINVPYFLARYLRLFDAVRKSGAHISVIAPELLIIDMAELVRLHICAHFDDTWAWVAKRPERQPDAAAGAPAVAEDAPAFDEGDHAVLAPVQAPQQPPPPPPPPAARTVPQRLGRLEKDVQGLYRDVGSLCGLVERSMSDQGRFSTWMMTCMTQLMDASGLAYQAFDRTF
ncbi:hypothetical protein Tco_0646204 [Tanacetum coccineum]